MHKSRTAYKIIKNGTFEHDGLMYYNKSLLKLDKKLVKLSVGNDSIAVFRNDERVCIVDNDSVKEPAQKTKTADSKKKTNTEQKWKDQAFYANMLRGEECLCGRKKKRGFAFCYTCFKKLPTGMKDGLYRRIGNGFEEAFDAALRWLE